MHAQTGAVTHALREGSLQSRTSMRPRHGVFAVASPAAAARLGLAISASASSASLGASLIRPGASLAEGCVSTTSTSIFGGVSVASAAAGRFAATFSRAASAKGRGVSVMPGSGTRSWAGSGSITVSGSCASASAAGSTVASGSCASALAAGSIDASGTCASASAAGGVTAVTGGAATASGAAMAKRSSLAGESVSKCTTSGSCWKRTLLPDMLLPPIPLVSGTSPGTSSSSCAQGHSFRTAGVDKCNVFHRWYSINKQGCACYA